MQKFNQIAKFGKELMGLDDMQNIINLIAKEAKTLVNAERCSIFIVDHDDKML